MTKFAILLACLFACSSATAQPRSLAGALHAQALVLDDGNGHTYSIEVPNNMQTSSTYTLPLIPSSLPTAGYVLEGFAIGQTLSWNGSSWQPSSALLNDGTNIIASGSLTALQFIGGGAGLTALNASALNGIVPLISLSGITSAQLAPNAGITDGQIVSISASKIIGSLPNLNGASITNLSPANLSPGTATINIIGHATSADTAALLTGTISESQVVNLTNDLASIPSNATLVHTSGNESIGGTKTFTLPIVASITGNAATATSAAALSGTISESQVVNLTNDLASIPNAAALVHTSGNESIGGTKTFTLPIVASITGNAATATSAAALSGTISESQVVNLTNDLANIPSSASLVHTSGNESIGGTKTFTSAIAANITGNAATATSAAALSGSISESQVTGLTQDLATIPSSSSIVHNTGDESIAGIKTFTSTIVGNISGNAATSADGLTSASGTAPLTLTLTAKSLTGSIAAASHTVPGTMSAADKTKLDAITGTNTGDQTITLIGDISGSGTAGITTQLSTTGVAANTYTKVTVDTKGRVTNGAALASGDIPDNAANTTGNAANVTGIVAVANGGTGTNSGSIAPTGNYSVTQNSVAVVTSESASAAANTLYLKQGNVGIGTTPSAKLDVNGTAQMTGFKLPTNAVANYVLTSDANGVGTWQAAPSGSGGSGTLSGGTANYIPLWSSSSALTSSAIYQSSGQVSIGNTQPGATLDVTGSGKFSGLLTANGGVTLGGTLTLGGNAIAADTGKSVGKYVLVSADILHGYIDISCANVTASSEIFITPRRPSGLSNNTRYYLLASVGAINTSTHTVHIVFAGSDFAAGDIINWWVIN